MLLLLLCQYYPPLLPPKERINLIFPLCLHKNVLNYGLTILSPALMHLVQPMGTWTWLSSSVVILIAFVSLLSNFNLSCLTIRTPSWILPLVFSGLLYVHFMVTSYMLWNKAPFLGNQKFLISKLVSFCPHKNFLSMSLSHAQPKLLIGILLAVLGIFLPADYLAHRIIHTSALFAKRVTIRQFTATSIIVLLLVLGLITHD